MTTPSPDELVKVYIKIRQCIKDKETEHKENIAALKDQFQLVSNELLEHCKVNNSEAVRTEFGTFYRTVRTKYWTSDWAALYDFIQAHNAAHLLEKRINTRSMEEFLTENPDLLPLGLNSDKAYTVQVRKPTTK
jgi:hypothetical protein|tara:strand:- start:416 stop:817 length:402 start_codon:yes stop_codon:yes gene_type:complete